MLHQRSEQVGYLFESGSLGVITRQHETSSCLHLARPFSAEFGAIIPMRLIVSILKLIRHVWRGALSVVAKSYLRFWGVQFGRDLHLQTLLFCRRHPDAVIRLGNHVTILNTTAENSAGIDRRTALVASEPGATLLIGNNVGMSGATIHCAHSVRIEDNVNLGANAKIYDTDFHPLDYLDRRGHDRTAIRKGPVIIGEDVWVGADAIILKNVTVGERSIIAARAVVTADVPRDCIVAGAPARVIRVIGRGTSTKPQALQSNARS